MVSYSAATSCFGQYMRCITLDVNHEYFDYEIKGSLSGAIIKHEVQLQKGLFDFYLLYNGKKIHDHNVVTEGVVHVIPRVRGGKGGFGSMLRAIGAQIEKTTNREACRDLSGRRLRDINEEKRLKNWIAQQAEREREAAERRRKKLEKLCVEPKHDFIDKNYEKERSELSEKVHDAVEQGFRSVSSSGSSKRKLSSQGPSLSKKKKTCLWVDIDDDLSSSLSSDESGEENKTSKDKVTKANDKDEILPESDTLQKSSEKSDGIKNEVRHSESIVETQINPLPSGSADGIEKNETIEQAL